jgi:hypothetical protein
MVLKILRKPYPFGENVFGTVSLINANGDL